jgi:hypothetical protein
VLARVKRWWQVSHLPPNDMTPRSHTSFLPNHVRGRADHKRAPDARCRRANGLHRLISRATPLDPPCHRASITPCTPEQAYAVCTAEPRRACEKQQAWQHSRKRRLYRERGPKPAHRTRGSDDCIIHPSVPSCRNRS